MEKQYRRFGMGNIIDYIDWRGDLPLSVDPFNEVDNLILSQLAYFDFSGLVPEPGRQDYARGFEIIEKANRRSRTLTDQLNAKDVPERFRQLPLLLLKVAASVRFGNMRYTNYMNIVDSSKDEQLAAITYILDDGSYYVAFRGTDDSLIGWKEDFDFSYMHQTAGQRDAVSYMDSTLTGVIADIRVGGHSKGGNIAVYAAAFCNPAVNERILTVYSNDSPGFIESLKDSPEFGKIIPRIKKFTPAYSIIGILMSGEVKPKVIQSTGDKVMQHDGFTWQVLGKSFLEADQREKGSIFFDQTIRTWVAGESTQNRKFFIDTLFGLLDKTGATTFSEVTKSKTQTMLKVLAVMREMPKESRDAFARIWLDLAKSRGLVWMNDFQSSTENLLDKLKENMKKADEVPAENEDKAAEGKTAENGRIEDGYEPGKLPEHIGTNEADLQEK